MFVVSDCFGLLFRIVSDCCLGLLFRIVVVCFGFVVRIVRIRLVITRDDRILLPERFDTEIRMRPLVKTVFLLFLRHPEGIRFGDLHCYRDELMDLYMGISGRNDREELERSIDRLIDPRDNSIHEKASNLAATLSRYFKPGDVPAYTLTGKAGAPKRIRLDRTLVEWE